MERAVFVGHGGGSRQLVPCSWVWRWVAVVGLRDYSRVEVEAEVVGARRLEWWWWEAGVVGWEAGVSF